MTNSNNEDDPTVDDVIIPQDDALPQSTRTGQGKMPEEVDDEDLQTATEQERVDAGLADYAPSDVPPATDPPPAETSEEAQRAERGLNDEQ